jgi:Spy/CpxP family protein refolding chaperone
MKTTKLILLLLTALLVGVCIGFFTNSAIIKARVRHYQEIPSHLSEHIMEKMTAGLDLTAGQQAAIQKQVDLFVEQRGEQCSTRKAKNAEQMAEMSRGVLQHLTPEQQMQFKTMMEKVGPRRKASRDLIHAIPEARQAAEQ